MAPFFWIFLAFSSVIWPHDVLAESDVDQLYALTERSARDIATLMEDVKVLLSIPHRDHAHNHGQSTQNNPGSCQDLRAIGADSDGLATIFIPSAKPHLPPTPLTVFCDQTTSGGGWIVLLRRIDTDENFPNRNWQDYKAGFGNPTVSSFWIGLEQMHQLTRDRHAILRVELEDFDGETRHAEYSYFRIAPESEGYRLFIDGYSGDAGDPMSYHNGQKFSTTDRDQDPHTSNCASMYKGAWWYNTCVRACLTGEYLGGQHNKAHQGVYWRHWRGTTYSYKRAEMKLRY